jgi:hypothetical protein
LGNEKQSNIANNFFTDENHVSTQNEAARVETGMGSNRQMMSRKKDFDLDRTVLAEEILRFAHVFACERTFDMPNRESAPSVNILLFN